MGWLLLNPPHAHRYRLRPMVNLCCSTSLLPPTLLSAPSASLSPPALVPSTAFLTYLVFCSVLTLLCSLVSGSSHAEKSRRSALMSLFSPPAWYPRWRSAGVPDPLLQCRSRTSFLDRLSSPWPASPHVPASQRMGVIALRWPPSPPSASVRLRLSPLRKPVPSHLAFLMPCRDFCCLPRRSSHLQARFLWCRIPPPASTSSNELFLPR